MAPVSYTHLDVYKRQGLQAIATRVSTGSECQIIIEDGRVKEDTAACNTVLQAPADTPAWKKGAF